MSRRTKVLIPAIIVTLLVSAAPAFAGKTEPDTGQTTETAAKDKGNKGGGKGIGKDRDKDRGKPTTTTTAVTTTTSSPPVPAATTSTTVAPTPTSTTTTVAPSTTTTTAVLPTTTLPPAPTTTTITVPPTTTTTPPPADPTEWISPEGVTVVIDTAGEWTTEQVYQMLLENALDLDEIGPKLTIMVQDVYASQASTNAVTSGGTYVDFGAMLYLKGVDSGFANTPDSVLAHEFGHVWSSYHLHMTHQGDWTTYLEARNISEDERLDGAYHWSRGEIIADDYRLLLGSSHAVAQRPTHMNPEIDDPSEVAGLRDFLLTVWSGS